MCVCKTVTMVNKASRAHSGTADDSPDSTPAAGSRRRSRDGALLEPLGALRAPRLREAAYTAIREAILDGRLGSGQPLLEEEIAELLRISRTPVREALALLVHDRLVAPRRGRGLWVKVLSRNEFIDMFVANETVEPYLARRAAAAVTPSQVRQMREAIEMASECAGSQDIAGFLSAGRRFHQVMGEASGNAALCQFVVQNEERTDLHLLAYMKHLGGDMMAPSASEHASILDAIAEGRAEDAARLVVYHSQSVRQRLGSFFDDEIAQ
jgi:DNA-binding GntR family transcriptional regulator